MIAAKSHRALELIVQIAPAFPPKLKKKGEEGIVRVEFVVDTQGQIVNAFVFESTNHNFDEGTLAAVAKWKFRPGLYGGRKVNTARQDASDAVEDRAVIRAGIPKNDTTAGGR